MQDQKTDGWDAILGFSNRSFRAEAGGILVQPFKFRRLRPIRTPSRHPGDPKKISNRMQRWAADDLVQIATQLRALVDPLKIDRGRRDSRDEYWRSKYKSMAARA